MTPQGAAPLTHFIGTFDQQVHHEIDSARQLAVEVLERSKAGGRYVVREELARGGMGVINEVYDQDLRRISAMKVIASEMMHDKRRVMSFISEGRITAQLEHPNIVPVHELGVVDTTGCPFYTMKLVEGEPLHRIINRLMRGEPAYVRTYTRQHMLDIFRKICDALAYAHSRHVIHRDVKPENVMVGNFGEVLLMDWGLAKYVERDASSRNERSEALGPAFAAGFPDTQDGTIKGSLAYLSPEQAYGDLEDIDEQTDIFLLGATLYHMLTRRPPYDGATVDEILRRAEQCDYLIPREFCPQSQVPLALERIILRAMAPLKRNRYESVMELIEELDAFRAGKRVCGRRIFAPGERLICHGEFSLDSYVIVNGQVQVSRVVNGRDIPIATLGRGEIVGEMAGITHQMRSANVTAKTTTEVLVITHEQLMEELEKLPPWMEKIVFSLAERVRILDDNVHPLLLKSRGYHIVAQLYYIFAAGRLERQGTGEEPSYPYLGLLDEVAMNLGIDKKSTQDVLDTLLECNVLNSDDGGQITVPNYEEFALFTDYCRYQFDVKGGLREVTQIRLDPSTESHFRRALRKLRERQEMEAAESAASN